MGRRRFTLAARPWGKKVCLGAKKCPEQQRNPISSQSDSDWDDIQVAFLGARGDGGDGVRGKDGTGEDGEGERKEGVGQRAGADGEEGGDGVEEHGSCN